MSGNSEFLESLKVGDQVVVRNRRLDTWNRNHGPNIYTVVSFTPKRKKFVLRDAGNRTLDLSDRQLAGIEPLTAAARKEHDDDTVRIRARAVASKMLYLLPRFEEFSHSESIEGLIAFLDSTELLMEYLKVLQD